MNFRFTTLLTTTIFISFGVIWAGMIQAQTIADFDNNPLDTESYWNGNDQSGGFTSGNAFFTNTYDTSWGGFWSAGFAYSNKTDSITPGFGNLYSAITAGGHNGTSNYAIGQQGAVVRLNGDALGKVVSGFYVTNTTYAYWSMKEGDNFAKKFGGETGDDSDWFRISITGFFESHPVEDTVHFYLADFRFSDNSQNYILRDWEWVDLTPLGNIDSLTFHLASSDTGEWGMNTPAFFAMDYFTTADAPLLAQGQEIRKLKIYPNPANETLFIDGLMDPATASAEIFNISGKLMERISLRNGYIRVADLTPGMYILKVSDQGESITIRLLKQ